MARLPPPDPRIVQAARTLQEAMHCQRLGQHEAAERHYAQVLKKFPDYFDALLHYGLFKYQQDRLPDALKLLTRAAAVNPRSIDALNNLGSVLFGLKREQDSLAAFNRALALDPRNVDTLYNVGYALDNLKRHTEALAYYEQALAVQPDCVAALYNRARVLHELKRYDEALASVDRALAIQPDVADALNVRGLALLGLNRPDEALRAFDRALVLWPDFANAHCNRGHALLEMKRIDEALAAYRQALTIAPDSAHAHLSEASGRLLIGDFERGWEQYEWRWEVEPQRSFKRNFAQPQWQKSQDIAGKTILLHYEQGYGDTIQFCRYVPLVAERGARVILEVLKLQKELMRGLPGVAQLIAYGEPIPDFDVQCPLATLPAIFETRLDNMPVDIPYLRASAPDVVKWQQRLGPKTRPRIGINWAGYSGVARDAARSIGLPPLLPLLSVGDAEFFSIQKVLRPGDRELLASHPNVVHLGDESGEFEYTAALMENLDLVISSDTSVVHLAGALGKPVWTLLAYIPDWRWLLDRNDSPWYPTMRLFRQPKPGEWDSVIERVREALVEFAAAYRADRPR